MEHAPEERLRWRVLKEFGVLPGERRARAMTDREFLYCTLQLWLDEEEKLEGMCPSCRSKAAQARCTVCGAPLADPDGAEGMENTAFDIERFQSLQKGQVEQTL